MVEQVFKLFGSHSHEANIDFLKEFYSSRLGFGNINKANRYRILRNDIKYLGLLTTKNEAEDVLNSMNALLRILFEIVQQEFESKKPVQL